MQDPNSKKDIFPYANIEKNVAFLGAPLKICSGVEGSVTSQDKAEAKMQLTYEDVPLDDTEHKLDSAFEVIFNSLLEKNNIKNDGNNN